jgi:hypothetical protein
MKRFIVTALSVCLVAAGNAAEPTPGGTHYKAAEKMLTLMDMESVLRKTIDEMLKAQISQNPGIAPVRGGDEAVPHEAHELGEPEGGHDPDLHG